VDIVGQYASYYSLCERRSKKWWKKLFWQLFEIYQFNSYIIYSMANDSKIGFLKYKRNLLSELARKSFVDLEGVISYERKTPGRPVTEPLPFRLKKDCMHLVDCDDKSRVCKVCSSRSQVCRKETNYYCISCPDHPHLHAKTCFAKYHQHLNYKS